LPFRPVRVTIPAVWPTLFKIGPLELGTFGLMAALGFLAAYFVLRAEAKRRGLEVKLASEMLVAAIIGGFVGARVNYIVEYWDAFVASPWSMIWTRSGFTWYGGLAGGALAVIILLKARGQKLGPYADALAPAIALGYVFGRAG
jgi:phosphatidylglycerol:prolipoprotein diacylglycerol transferase